MMSNKKYAFLRKKEIFYAIVFILGAIGIYIAEIIEDQYKIIANGIIGILVPYLIYLAFVSRKNATKMPIDFEALEFPKDIKYLFYGFFWGMIMFWSGSLILDLVRYLLSGITGR